MHGGISHDKNVRLSVRPSVCLSVKRVNCDKTKEIYARIFIRYKRPIILVFQQEEWLVGGDLLFLKFWAKLTLFLPVHSKTPIFDRFSLVAPQP